MRTKKRLIKEGILIISMMFILITAVKAQRFHGGIMAGGVVSQVQGDSYGGFDKFGIYAGGFVNLAFSDMISLQTEINFIQKGSRDNADYDKEKYDSYLLRLNYIEVPLLFRLTFFDRLTAEIGPTMDVLVSSSERNELGPVENEVQLRPVTMSGIIGASVFVIPKLEIKFRFSMSILSIRESVGDDEYYGFYKRFGQLGQYCDQLALTVAYRFK
jgi:hypothetical protein